LLDYLRSWSAAQRYHQATGGDAVAEISDELRRAWGDAQRKREVRWQLAIRSARVD